MACPTVCRHLVLFFISCFLFSVSGFAQPVQEQPTVDETTPDLTTVVTGVQQFYDKTSSFKASFTQTVTKKFRPGGKPGTTRSGTAYFLKPGKMRWDYETPESVYYVSDGDILWVYDVAQNTAYKGTVKGSRMYDSMKFLFGSGSLSDEFVTSLGESTKQTIELNLVQKSGQQNFKSLTLVVDRTSFEIKETRIVDPAGDVSTIQFTNPSYKPIKNPEWFSWAPAPNVRVEDISKYGQ
ncbi:MAG: outer membrane lipoprotein carrier protein LolA [Myxococcales bacterium]|nr:outer membrane lipoprotein carrier protein LolA [Myxococcales bacterium]